jgi:membrane protease YdiL (CAAX protease family)
LILVSGFFFVIAVAYRATADDLGLPRSIADVLRETCIGIVTCFAALIPVRATQGFLLWLMGRQEMLSHHPLIDTLTSGGGIDFWVMALACASAVIVAPLCEEVAFRLLFQGWLEKLEDEELALGTLASSSGQAASMENSPLTIQNGEARMTNDQTPNSAQSSFDIRHSSLVQGQRQPGGLFGLPHGWLPILASSLLFGLAHIGYGPEPVPLFIFGLFLGYVFQRTNRILPCIVAHAFFNLVSMLALWRIIMQGVD